MEVRGKVALVTGAGSGIGQAMALRLASLGAKVVVADIDDAGAAETVAQATGAGGTASALQLDVTSGAAWGAAVQEVERRYGGLQILHNNAGITVGQGEFPGIDPARLELVVRTNLLGVMLGTHAALPALQKSGGVVVNTASASGLRPWTNDAVYSATKAGVVFFTQALAPAIAPLGVRINCVCPGVVRTPLVFKGQRFAQMTAAEQEMFRKQMAAQPLIEPSEVVDALMDQVTDDSLNGEARPVTRNPLPEGTIGGVV